VTSAPPYAELDACSNFSFLEGASHPAELAAQAKALGIAALGLSDRNSLAGVVRAHVAAKEQGLQLLVGARLVFQDGATLIVYPRDRAAYGRLCRLLSLGKSGIDGDDSPDGVDPDRIGKGQCRLDFAQAASLGEGLIALAPAPAFIDDAFQARLTSWRRLWPDDLYLATAPLYRGDDRARLAQLAAIGKAAAAPIAATNAVLYHHPDRRRLQDILTCIREKTSIDEAGYRLQANAERGLKAPAEMARLFRGHEGALARTWEIAQACRFSLDELAYVYPDEPVPPGLTADRHLRRLSIEGARRAFPKGTPPAVVKTLRKELRLIRKLRYAPYFLTVHDIVAWARAHPRAILCQGRGSAANSVVCFCLGVTAVNPAEQDVLFERFISEERSEPPDIDVDFEHERRELVIQYIYRRYGRHRAAICATVIHYRPRSAIRDVCRALGLTEDVASALANTVWGSFGSRLEDAHVDAVGVAREDPRLALALELTHQLIGFPRHLSQHVGGFVLTQGPLIETVPVGNAAMADRTFIEWDKDDIDALKIMKVDVLALGMLTAIRRSFEMIEEAYGPRLTLAAVPRERARVYDMLCRADSLGVFQVESRAQMNMLPRLRPREFYDLVVQVAIVRPGPIQGDMVHPYLKRRTERREAARRGRAFEVAYPSPAPEHGRPDELKRVLHKTLGVPLFQEQAMRIAMEAACFTGDEANGLRRAMATFRNVGTIGTYEEMMVGRMIARGYPPDFARNCFNQIKGFGEYGFPESHAASFAQLVYVSSWLKCVFPEVFTAALLNSQPMGFYAPAQIVRDARAHDVTVRAPDVNASDWACTLESAPRRRRRAVRLGFNRIDGFRQSWAVSIATARAGQGAFASLDDVQSRAGLPSQAIDALAAADALRSLDLDRRTGLWRAKGLVPIAVKRGAVKGGAVKDGASSAPLFAAMGLEEGDAAEPVRLDSMGLSEEVVADYETLRLSLKAHPMSFLRAHFASLGAVPATAVAKTPDGRRTATAGIVLVRQRPGTAKGVVFLTIEDETGVANIVVWPKLFEQFRPIAMGARLILVRGRVQYAEDAPAGGVIHLVAETLEDRTADLDRLSAPGVCVPRLEPPYAPGDEPGHSNKYSLDASHRRPPRSRHPRDVRPIPRSRDFH
jgi:error-prone DNA polymerase